MRLRLKGEMFANQVVTEFDSNCVTVSKLKIRVQDILQINDEEFFRYVQI